MSRGRQAFRQGDVTKAVKGAVNAGVTVKRVEISDGKIVVITSDPSPLPSETTGNEWDVVK
jgi:hypothetical protein